MSPSRRQFLAVGVGLTGALAGCLGGSEETPTGPSRTIGGEEIAVTGIEVKKAARWEVYEGRDGIETPEDRQFVVASVSEDPTPNPGMFTLRTADDFWVGGGVEARSFAGHGGGLVGQEHSEWSDRTSYLSFTVPSPLDIAEQSSAGNQNAPRSSDAEDPRIVLDQGGETAEWPLPEDAVETLVAPSPSFELASIDAPDSVEQGSTLGVTLTVRNTSEVDGRFLAEAHWPTEGLADDDETHVFADSIDAGETATPSVSIDTERTVYEDGAVTLDVHGHVDASTEIAVDVPE